MITAVATAGSISVIAIIIAVVVTILVVVACTALALYVILRKYKVHPDKKIPSEDHSRLQDSGVKMNAHQITRVKVDELDSDEVTDVSNVVNLKGKSVREKK